MATTKTLPAIVKILKSTVNFLGAITKTLNEVGYFLYEISKILFPSLSYQMEIVDFLLVI